MKTIKGLDRNTYNLSDEVFMIVNWDHRPPSGYEIGTVVRFISGTDGSEEPGHHFKSLYATVCRTDTKTAEFIGVRRCDLRPLGSEWGKSQNPIFSEKFDFLENI